MRITSADIVAIIVALFAAAVIGCVIFSATVGMSDQREKEYREKEQKRIESLRKIHLPEIEWDDYKSLTEAERAAFINKGGKIK